MTISMRIMAVFFACVIASSAHSQMLLTEPLAKVDAAEGPVIVEQTHRLSEDSASLVLELTFRMKPRVYIYRAESLFFRIDETHSTGLGESKISLPPAKVHGNFDGSMVEVLVDGQTVRIVKPVKGQPWEFAGYVQYQACDKTQCFLPKRHAWRISNTTEAGSAVSALDETNIRNLHTSDVATRSRQELLGYFDVAGTAAGYLDEGAFLAFLRGPSSAKNAGSFDGKSIWLVLVLVLLGGFALNLTPCILPMIPITMAVLGAETNSGTKKRGFLLGSAYGAGIGLVYGLLGLIVVLTGMRFGVLNSSPVFNFAIAALFVVLSMAMFDIIHIDLTGYRKGIPGGGRGKGKAVTAFITGAIAALLAGACVAPVVISVVLYSTAQYSAGHTMALLLPFLLGAGMALPWPFAGAGLSFLPKPGRWMVWVRNAFGVIILVVALYYIWTGISLITNKVSDTTPSPVGHMPSKLPWVYSLEEGLAKAKEEGKPVFIDFWASWCKNCLAMDATVFRAPAVEREFGSYVLIKHQAENPEDERNKPILDYFNVIGLPTYVVLLPK